MARWIAERPEERHRALDGTLLFADLSGFTRTSERLARLGQVGAEQLTDLVNRYFETLLGVAFEDGGDLLKFGGDALLLLFQGDGHPLRGVHAAAEMRSALRRFGPQETEAGRVSMRISFGVHSGPINLFLLGESHRELVVTGPGATLTKTMEGLAASGQILMSEDCAARIDPQLLGRRIEDGYLLRGSPPDLSAQSQDARPPGDEVLAQTIPAALRRHLSSGVHESEHRHVAIGFVRFEGTDEAIGAGDVQHVQRQLDTLLLAAEAAAARFDLCVLQSDIDTDGGKVILTGGAPDRHEHDEANVLRALHEIAEVEGVPVLRLGAASGRVFAGEVGHSRRRVYTVMGDAVNLAARLMAHASPGELLTTPEMVAEAGGGIEVTEVPSFRAKGKRRPVAARRVDDVRDLTAVAADTRPMVGRERELARLLEAAAAAMRGEGGALELCGPPGIGKSRLAAELRARTSFGRVLSTRCGPYAMASPYFPFRSLIRELLGVPPDASTVEAGKALRVWATAHAPELRPWLPLIANVMGAEVESTAEVDRLDPAFTRAQLHARAMEFLERALTGSSLLVFEDVHWADQASLDFLEHLAEHASGMPWLILLTRRSEAVRPWDSDAEIVTLDLDSLASDVLIDVANQATEDRPLTPSAIQSFVARAGGNPLFLLELLSAARAGSDGELPASVDALIASRIDLLAPADQQTLRRAAVLGLETDLPLLEELLEGDPGRDDVRASLNRLAEFIEVTEPDRIRFRHAVARDAAYEGLAYRRRRELHLRAAEATERQAGDDREQFAELLSLHFVRARVFDKAWTYAVNAGDLARTRFANSDAAALYRRAIESVRHLGSVERGELAAVHEALGDVLQLAGEAEQAARAFSEATRAADGDGVALARLMRKQGELRERSGAYPSALRWYTRGLRQLERVGRARVTEHRAELRLSYAGVRYRQGKYRECLRWAELAVADARRADARGALGHAYYVIDNALRDLGEKPRFRDQSLGIFDELGDLVLKAKVLNNIAVDEHLTGRWTDALGTYERSREAAAQAGDVMMTAMVANNVGEILSDQGRLEEAERTLSGALRDWRSIDFRAGVALATSNLGRVASRAGRRDAADALLNEAIERFGAIGATHLVLETRARLAESWLLTDDDRALAYAEETLHSMTATRGLDVARAMLERAWGDASARAGELDMARELLTASVGRARAARADFELALALRSLAHLEREIAISDGREHEGEASSLLAQLGVVAAEVPLRANGTSAEPR